MDFPLFRDEYDALTSVLSRAELLVAFGEEAMQSCPDDLAPLVVQCRLECLAAGLSVEAALLDRLAGWLAVDRADYPQALELFHRAEAAFVAENVPAGRLKALNGIATVHLGQGRFEAALSVYRQASALAAGLGDRAQGTLLEANIGETLIGLHQYAEAEDHLKRARDSGLLNPLNQSLVLNQLARACIPQGRRDEARRALDHSVFLARAGGFLPALSVALDLIGVVELARGNTGEAEGCLEESRAVARQAGDRASETQATIDLGWLSLERKPGSEALDLFRQALALARSIGAPTLEAEALRGVSQACKARGEWREALEAHELYHGLTEQVHSETVTGQVAQIKADQARRETELYREQSRILARLGDLGQRITASLKLEDIVLEVSGAIGDLMQADGFGLGLYDEQKHTIDYQLFVEEGRRIPPFVAPVGEQSFSGWCLRHRQPILMSDVENDYARYIPSLPARIGTNGKRTRSCLYTPLEAEGKVLGVLSAQSYQLGAYGDRDLATLKTLGASIAIAIQNARLFDQITRMATVDPLTGAATRGHLFDRAEQEFQRFLRSGIPLALVMIDLDRFKELNDTWGHAAGDRVLAEFGALCLGHKRPHDVFGRYGGEEFALILSGTSLDGAVKSAERLCSSVREMALTTPDGQPLSLTASFGVTDFGPGDAEVTRVFGRADEALYEAKQSGRDRVAVRLAEAPTRSGTA